MFSWSDYHPYAKHEPLQATAYLYKTGLEIDLLGFWNLLPKRSFTLRLARSSEALSTFENTMLVIRKEFCPPLIWNGWCLQQNIPCNLLQLHAHLEESGKYPFLRLLLIQLTCRHDALDNLLLFEVSEQCEECARWKSKSIPPGAGKITVALGGWQWEIESHSTQSSVQLEKLTSQTATTATLGVGTGWGYTGLLKA